MYKTIIHNKIICINVRHNWSMILPSQSAMTIEPIKGPKRWFVFEKTNIRELGPIKCFHFPCITIAKNRRTQC